MRFAGGIYRDSCSGCLPIQKVVFSRELSVFHLFVLRGGLTGSDWSRGCIRGSQGAGAVELDIGVQNSLSATLNPQQSTTQRSPDLWKRRTPTRHTDAPEFARENVASAAAAHPSVAPARAVLSKEEGKEVFLDSQSLVRARRTVARARRQQAWRGGRAAVWWTAQTRTGMRATAGRR